MEYSYPLIQLIFNCSSLEPQFEQKSKFLEHFEDDYQIKKLINDKNEPKINENLLYRFEIVIDKYFQKIVKNGNDANQLCGNLSKNYLEKAINYFYQSNNVQKIILNNICKLYSIAYIKRYMNYLVEIMCSKDGYQKFCDRESVNEILYRKEVLQKKIVFFYCLKIFII